MNLENIEFESNFNNSKYNRVKEIINLIVDEKLNYKLISEFKLNKREVFDIFNTRFEIQKFVTKIDAIQGYEDLLFNINNISNEVVFVIIVLKAEEFFIQLFINSENEKIVGVLWNIKEN